MGEASADESRTTPSGLRNPAAAVRGVGAAALAAEGLVLLLAIVPLRVLGAAGAGGTILVVVLAVVSFALAGLLRHALGVVRRRCPAGGAVRLRVRGAPLARRARRPLWTRVALRPAGTTDGARYVKPLTKSGRCLGSRVSGDSATRSARRRARPGRRNAAFHSSTSSLRLTISGGA